MNVLRRRYWINGGLLALAGGLAALAWFDPGQKSPVISPLLPIPISQIEQITVVRPGQETLAFTRQDQRWRMTAPDSGWANPVLIQRVLGGATLRCPRQYPVAELDLPTLQLKPSRLQLRLNEWAIHFGGTTPAGGLRYLQVGATVHFCPDALYPLLTSAAAGFLAPVIEPFESSATKAH